MLDPKLLRTQLLEVEQNLARRGYKLDINTLNRLENERKALQVQAQELQNQRNQNAKQIGQAKAAGQDCSSLLKAVDELKTRLIDIESRLEVIQQELLSLQQNIPNLLQDSVPAGLSEADNVEIRRWGQPKQFDFTPLDHVDLGVKKGWMDFESAAKIARSRFVVLYGPLARLQRALIQFMLDTHTQEQGYQEVYVPYLANRESLVGTAQLPKMRDDQFQIVIEPELFLIPTAEVPVTNLVRDEILDAGSLPLKYVCHSPCFRSEAGSYGKDTRGMIRQHQFEKVELVQLVNPEDSESAHEALTQHAETILQRLGLPYRVMALCAGDTSFASSKTYDLEVWLPSQKTFREISSCSNFRDFQARRLLARWRNPVTNKPELLHTLNGSALAAGRTLVAVMENYQDKEGNIHLPEVLWPYMGGLKVLT